ncbi:MAG: hypothetical protein QM654_00740 [Dysgonamonadaceae bacterium]
MTATVIITFCVLVILAYLFDLTSSKTKIPSVILLLVLGWELHQIAGYFSLSVPDLSPALPILGTVGLILIVLEGALELDFNKSKAQMIKKSFLMAFVPMVGIAFLMAYLCTLFGFPDFKKNLINVIPLCVISSAIAIPSVNGLSHNDKEFVVYESSLSDILGILFFNFVALNEHINLDSVFQFSFQIVLILAISLVATLGLALLMNKITHHIKYVPIVFIIILIYELSKEYELPGLIFILIFGLFLGNLKKFRQNKYLSRLDLKALKSETFKFQKQVSEATFLIRSLFFILFGYLIRNDELFNADTFVWALGICGIIFLFRAFMIKVLKLKMFPLLTVAPRGLITILLFMSILPQDTIPIVSESLIIQMIVITAVVMMLGLMFHKSGTNEPIEEDED